MAETAGTFNRQVANGGRFEFGKNWSRFLRLLNDDRIVTAQHSLHGMLQTDLAGRSFLDIGSGSGLFSLAAMRLGAARVHSFDYDPQSVACTDSLRRRFFPDDPRWTVERGSALDTAYLDQLGCWDVVYSWGVLHHTGEMWNAIDNAAKRVETGGQFYLAIYNDQGLVSRGWLRVKRLYNVGSMPRLAVCAVFFPYFIAGGLTVDLLNRRNPLRRYRTSAGVRGMSAVIDWHDWLGGYPFEVAKPEAILDFARTRGFELRQLRTCGGRMGCNEFVFERRA